MLDEDYSNFCELLLWEDHSVEECQEMLDLSDDEVNAIVARLQDDGYINLHTIH